MAHTTEIDILLHPWGAKPSFMRMGITGGCGHQGALMDGTWDHQRITTNALFITSLKPGHIAYWGQRNYFRNIANYQT